MTLTAQLFLSLRLLNRQPLRSAVGSAPAQARCASSAWFALLAIAAMRLHDFMRWLQSCWLAAGVPVLGNCNTISHRFTTANTHPSRQAFASFHDDLSARLARAPQLDHARSPCKTVILTPASHGSVSASDFELSAL
ncbi:hypothetical protein P154DRAFT_580021 [Amniculicola lignicola CBS 123094]|uniref:Uncharacterized protein n=1 Tax=Amniculicola lignicola CBS 123094 TaxID=1392246 RepID=A0A6A5W2X4_9PLEO|nr:hypothetical protein P154DRAFT_580021 [Amniculicola lignicola CBS 123094]